MRPPYVREACFSLGWQIPGNVTKMTWNVPARRDAGVNVTKRPVTFQMAHRSRPSGAGKVPARLVTFLARPGHRKVPVTGMFLPHLGTGNVTSLAGTLPTGAGTICHLERYRVVGNRSRRPPGGNVPGHFLGLTTHVKAVYQEQSPLPSGPL